MISWDDFKNKSLSDCVAIAPSTLVLANGGTRRRALLADVTSENYPEWSRNEMFSMLKMFFDSGVQNIFCVIFSETNAAEVSVNYREHMSSWVAEMLPRNDALDFYNQEGWRVHLDVLGWSGLSIASKTLEQTQKNSGPGLWFTMISSPEDHWQRLVSTIGELDQPPDRTTLIRSIYGEDIPPASMYIGSGKPQLMPSLINPLLIGSLACYWPQHLGYSLDQLSWKKILYDYAYLRPTWVADKSKRTELATTYRSAWEDDPPLIGVGQRLGPFWFPE